MTIEIQPIDEKKVFELCETLSISEFLASVLVARGMNTLHKAQSFLSPHLLDLHNPFLLPDMQRAVERIRRAIATKERVMIYGDKDVDGQTSVALLMRILQQCAVPCVYYIPVAEGYGLTHDILQRLIDEKYSLLITVDCGITNCDEITALQNQGIDVIVLDHHEPLATLPPAYAVVDAKRHDSVYPFRNLAGCGVVFKCGYALLRSYLSYYNTPIVGCSVTPKDELVVVKMINGIIVDQLKTKSDTLTRFLDDTHTIVVHTNQLPPSLQSSLLKNIQIINLATQYHDEDMSLEDVARQYHIPMETFSDEYRDATACAMLLWKIVEQNDIGLRVYIEQSLDMVCLGTLADISPLVDENRVLVTHGLTQLRSPSSKGLEALVTRVCSSDTPRTPHDVGWIIAPTLNAAGRLRQPTVAVELLVCNDAKKSNAFVDQLILLNDQRKQLQEYGYSVARNAIEQGKGVRTDRAVCVASKEIDRGVTGLVALSLAKTYGVPSLVLAIEGEQALGSVRSNVEHCNVVHALSRCHDLLTKYGGHKAAAGLTLGVENIPALQERFASVMHETLDANDTVTTIHVDIVFPVDTIMDEFFSDLTTLAPFGVHNENPVILFRNVKIINLRCMGADNVHCKCDMVLGAKRYEVVGWNKSELFGDIREGEHVDVVGEWKQSRYNGVTSWRVEMATVQKIMHNA